eukprot:TRINITY_DN17467_c0_g1_i1.p1 TRINITY_DN17467_c0_g1~~TRINITY_DN17467_c0_g1_i1.p1  ORF type:complete len:383 (+),score=58.27 TRINITY_DN17467_c0_g1_i1:25-1173(+)
MVESDNETERILINAGISVGLVISGGIFSGLTMAILSQDRLDLEILSKSGTENEISQANRILPLVNRHHLVLVTLLLANAVCSESLPIFLDAILNEYASVIISVTAVLIAGEIIPQAVCSRYGIAIGAALSWFVWGLIGIFFIVSFPIGKLLDLLLGDEKFVFYRRNELKELVSIHQIKEDEDTGLTLDEVSIIRGAIDLKEMCVSKAMTSIEKTFMLSFDEKLTPQTIYKIVESGHSRIPVYRQSRENVIGMILSKKLLTIKPRDEIPVSKLEILRVPVVNAKMTMYAMMNLFQTGKSHLALVVDPVDHLTVQGIITIEDVLEELVGDISDETDVIRSLKFANALRKGAPSRPMLGSTKFGPGSTSLQNQTRRPSLEGVKL